MRWRTSRVTAERHRPAGKRLGSAGRNTDGDEDYDDDDNEAGDQQEADGELEIEGPGADGGHDVAVGADLGDLRSQSSHLLAIEHP